MNKFFKVEKIGKIFNVTDFEIFGQKAIYAKSPQTVVFDDFVRIYFSTCIKDNNKFLSKVAYVDMSLDLKKIIKISSEEVIPLGELGCFDEHGIFPFNVFKNKDEIWAYTTGWSRRKSVSVETSIGFAKSTNGGNTFIKTGLGPVLTSSLNEPFLVLDGFVKKYNGIYHMWYIFGTKWIKKNDLVERVYKIAHATSLNGISWKKEEGISIIPSILENECQALPTVTKVGNDYYMFFCYRNAFDFRKGSENSYKIGCAKSTDLKNWTRINNDILKSVKSSWDNEMQCYPHIFKINNEFYLLYNGNEFGKYGFGAMKIIWNQI